MCRFASLQRVLYLVTAVSTAMGTGAASAVDSTNCSGSPSEIVDTAPRSPGEGGLQLSASSVKRVGSSIEVRNDAVGDTETRLTRRGLGIDPDYYAGTTPREVTLP